MTHRDKEPIELSEYQQIFWSDFGSKIVEFLEDFKENCSDSQSDFKT